MGKLHSTTRDQLIWYLLPPAYVVRREGYVFRSVCLSTGRGGGGEGYPSQAYRQGRYPNQAYSWGRRYPLKTWGYAPRPPPPPSQTRQGLTPNRLCLGRFASCGHAGGLFLFHMLLVVIKIGKCHCFDWWDLDKSQNFLSC